MIRCSFNPSSRNPHHRGPTPRLNLKNRFTSAAARVAKFGHSNRDIVTISIAILLTSQDEVRRFRKVKCSLAVTAPKRLGETACREVNDRGLVLRGPLNSALRVCPHTGCVA